MKIGTAIFTYKRSKHTQKVIESLKKNYILPQKLFLFHDGIKDEKDYEEWERVNALIESIDWCDKEVIASKENKGLANSIVFGVNYMLDSCDAVIVLEDDCVPSRNFINFMYQCLGKYAAEKRIWSVGGYAWPIGLKPEKYDVYFTQRISSWGWATWKDRWCEYRQDASVLHKLQNSQADSVRLAAWGTDLMEMFAAQMAGKINSWAIYWALEVIAQNGLCIAPYRSLIQNIGMDGTGEHCGVTARYTVPLDRRNCKAFRLPDHPKIAQNVQRSFAALHGSYTVCNQDCKKENILVYGLGRFFHYHEKEINRNWYIKGFIDRNKSGYFAGKTIYAPNRVIPFGNEKILIMLADRKQAYDVAWQLQRKQNIPRCRIMIGTENANGDFAVLEPGI